MIYVAFLGSPVEQDVAWDAADQTGSWTLTNSSRTAQVTSWPGIASVLGDVGRSAGKRYFEVEYVTGASFGTAVRHDIGITRSRPVASGASGEGTGGGYRRGGAIFISGSSVGSVSALSDGDVVGVAIDLGSGDVWFSLNGAWTQGDPGTGYIPEGSVLVPNTYYPFASAESPAAMTVTLRAKTSEFDYPAPTGFSSWALS